MILKGVYYPRPTERYLVGRADALRGHLPRMRREDIKRYPAFTARGPKFVHKCQDCLALFARKSPNIEEAHPPFWPMTRSWDCTRAG